MEPNRSSIKPQVRLVLESNHNNSSSRMVCLELELCNLPQEAVCLELSNLTWEAVCLERNNLQQEEEAYLGQKPQQRLQEVCLGGLQVG